jgi:hypothetical protein
MIDDMIVKRRDKYYANANGNAPFCLAKQLQNN